jgi:homoserine kinase type II
MYQELSIDELKELFEQFSDDEIINHKLLSGGSANSNYWLQTSKGEYVIAVSQTKTTAETQVLADVLHYLADHSFETSKYYPTLLGSDVTVSRQKPVILKSYIKGLVPEVLSLDMAYKLGQQMARLHQIPPPVFLPQTHEYEIAAFEKLLAEQHALDHPFMPWIKETTQYLKASLDFDLPKCMIHGDIFSSNLVVTDAQEVVIMDFEEACYNYRVFDIGMTIIGTCVIDGKIQLELINTLLDAYLSINTLTRDEITAIKDFAVYTAAGTALWRFKQFNMLFPNDSLKDHYQEMCDIADEIRYNWPITNFDGLVSGN